MIFTSATLKPKALAYDSTVTTTHLELVERNNLLQIS